MPHAPSPEARGSADRSDPAAGGGAVRLVLFPVLVAILLWPVAWNGDPLGFPDTEAYYEQGGQVLDRIASLLAPTPPATAGASAPPEAAEPETRPVYTIRSVPFSVIVNASMRLAGEIGAVLLLAAATAWLVLLAVRDLPPGRAALAGLVTAGATTLPFYASQVMADVMAGWLVLIPALLAWRRWGRATTAALLALVFLAVASHYSHVALGLVVIPVLGVALAVQRRWALAVAAQVPLALALALNVSVGVAAGTGMSVAPARLPVLLARTLADGPGREYLAASCPEAGWTLCEIYDGDRPMPTRVGEALWGPDSIVARSTDAQRRAIAAEEVPFVLAVLREHPVEQAAALLRNAAIQLGSIGVGDVRRTEIELEGHRDLALSLERIEPDAAIRAMEPVQWAAVGAGLLGAVLALGAGGTPARWALGMLALGLLANAAICGGLSAPADRYQGRVIWALVLLGLALAPTPPPGAPSGRMVDRRGRLVRPGARGVGART